jgi:hypothetical protein
LTKIIKHLKTGQNITAFCTWSATFSEEDTNGVLRLVFGPERKVAKGDEMSKLQYEEVQNLYSSPNIIQVIKIKQDEIFMYN